MTLLQVFPSLNYLQIFVKIKCEKRFSTPHVCQAVNIFLSKVTWFEYRSNATEAVSDKRINTDS